MTSHVVWLTIAVHEGHQRRGVGRLLMNELLAWARSNPHVEKVELQVRSSNEPAIALYRLLGFVEEGRKTEAAEARTGCVPGRCLHGAVGGPVADASGHPAHVHHAPGAGTRSDRHVSAPSATCI